MKFLKIGVVDMMFIVRLLLSVVIALLISRIYFHEVTILKVAGLSAALLGFAYIFHYIRKRDEEG